MSRTRAAGVATSIVTALMAAALAVAPDASAVLGGTNADRSTSEAVTALVRPGRGGRAAGQYCGGTLVAPTWVLTAAHCGEVAAQGGVVAVVGGYDLNAGDGEERAVTRVVTYPGFGNPGTPDMALLALASASTKRPMPVMAPAAEPTYAGAATPGTVIGWGLVSPTATFGVPILQSATVNVLTDAACRQAAGPSVVVARHLCTGANGVSACAGDSGGPLLLDDTSGTRVVAGVSSFGPQTCGAGPAVYGRTSFFKSWIDETTASTSSGPAPATAPGLRLLTAGGQVLGLGAAGADLTGTCGARSDCFSIGAASTGAWVSSGNCRITSTGGAPALASPNADAPCFVAPTSSGAGAWALTTTGHVFPLGGDATSYGEVTVRVNGAWLHIEPVPTGGGYWLVGNDGGIFSFGTARFFGSTGNIRLNQPIVGMAATPSGQGYWMVARDGGIFTFGDAGFFGSAGGQRLTSQVIAMRRTPSGNGYWLVAQDGGVFNYGDAPFVGSGVGFAHSRVVSAASG